MPQTADEKQWTLTMFARNLDTGVAVWERQLVPPGGGDYFDANQNILVDLTIHGARTPALVHFDSNGWTFVLDRRSGQLIGSHTSDSTASWANATSRQDR